MFPKIAGLGIGVFVLALFGLRAYRVIDNTETVLLTTVFLMLLLFLRHLFQ
ncbi:MULTISPECIES: hypothetical protein [Kingella]|jgi:hypothetical protein|uniref:Uncharacterized protein n=1 Tax=Kingella bonacorsii TaxID=2796361 RepID=A0ABS1BS85_9NEIS|nr:MULTISPECIES: hypothetical protein [Kingella]MBK0396113.1 hypothetical protein [Kingella bonacorsii]